VLISWDAGVVIAVCLAAASLALRSRRWRRLPALAGFAWEAGVVFAVYAVWQLAGDLADTQVSGAVANAKWIWRFERSVHLPSEVSIQRLVLPHHVLTELLNGYYAIVHVPALIIFLFWLYFRHRDAYPHWRNVGALLTIGSVLIQMIPVAPPRLLPQLGFVDTAMRYKESVYAPGGLGSATQLAAMPSIHVAWAVFIAVAVISISRARWRWLILLYPATTTFVVLATANHWWLDGIVGAALLPLAIGVEAALRRLPHPAFYLQRAVVTQTGEP
jgi:hypothetical protein